MKNMTLLALALVLTMPMTSFAKKITDRVSVSPKCFTADFIDGGGNQWEGTGYQGGCTIGITFFVSPNSGPGNQAPIKFTSLLDALGDHRVPSSVKALIMNEYLPDYVKIQGEISDINESSRNIRAKERLLREIVSRYKQGRSFIRIEKSVAPISAGSSRLVDPLVSGVEIVVER